MSIYLRIVQGRPEGQCLTLTDGEYIVGYGPECHIQLKSAWVSRQHCILRVNSNQVVLRDLGSTSGTILNGQPVYSEQPLIDGDRISIGPLVLQIEFKETNQVSLALAE